MTVLRLAAALHVALLSLVILRSAHGQVLSTCSDSAIGEGKRHSIAFVDERMCASLVSISALDAEENSHDGDSSRIVPWKLGVVSGVALGALGASYIYVRNVWWKEDAQSFHFDSGPDLHYALNLDKAAHFYGGMIGADAFKDGLLWSGVRELPAHLVGAAFSALVQVGIEMKDGYAPRWGFSLYDVGSGSLGALYPTAKRYLPVFGAVDVKFSYWKRTNRYFEYHVTGQWNDDYINQTYWASVKVHDLLPASLQSWWPKWLALAVGFSLDESTDGEGGGNLEIYLSPDLDLTALFPTAGPFLSRVLHYLNYIKFPAPGIRFAPSFRFHPVYF